MPKVLKVPKHPRDMTTDEALNHIFHPEIVAHVKDLAANSKKPKEKKATK